MHKENHKNSFYTLYYQLVSLCALWLIVFFELISASYSFASYADNPGGDEADETFVLGDALYPTNLEEVLASPDVVKTDAKSKAAILDSGYSREAALLMGLYLPVTVVTEKDFVLSSPSMTLLIIPSGGLSSLKEPEKFKAALTKFVDEGGIVFVFSQRVGTDYSILPVPSGEHLHGYGWVEDQSGIENSAMLLQYNTLVSGVSSARPHINIDGYFTGFPRTSKTVINKRDNGQPVFLIYKYGKGSVYATTLFTDWAYLHMRSTWDEISIFNNILKNTGIHVISSAPKRPPKEPGEGKYASFPMAVIPPLGFSVQSDNEIYKAEEKATFTIRLWNNGDKKRIIKVYYDNKGQNIQLQPHGASQFTYSIPVFSTRRLWVYFYDENEIFLQTLKRGYIVVYPENPDDKEDAQARSKK